MDQDFINVFYVRKSKFFFAIVNDDIVRRFDSLVVFIWKADEHILPRERLFEGTYNPVCYLLVIN